MSASAGADRGVLVDTTSVPIVPWRNGAGTTREIWTEGDPVAWRWRLSLADLSEVGPFSAHSGFDRCHLPIDGGYALSIDGEPYEASAGEPISFTGESSTVLTRIDAPTRALNLITRRSSCAGRVRVGSFAGPHTWPSSVRAVCLLSGTGATAQGDVLPSLGVMVAGAEPVSLDLTDAVVAEIHIDH